MSPQLSAHRRPTDIELFEGGLPDMIEVVRFAARPGRGPALTVSQRKMSGPLLARLRRLANDADNA